MPARQLPDRPSLEHYKKQAKQLLKAWRDADPASLARIKEYHPRSSATPDLGPPHQRLTLADAQLVIAREHGFKSWPDFARHVESALVKTPEKRVWQAASEAIVNGDVRELETLLRDHAATLRARPPRSGWWGHYSQGDARSIIAKEHFFDSWEQFAAFRDALEDEDSLFARFEAAVDAVVNGDVLALQRLLRKHPELIRARSPRRHRATLLHYVAANGVEGFRQRTPKNVVKVTHALLQAGADIDAVADMYGGANTLGLVATSIHPITAGVHEDLMSFLLSRGASVTSAKAGAKSSGIVNACLANGRPGAAEFLAKRGAPLDLEAAAGIGRMDVVERFFTADGVLTGGATERQRNDGFSWACEYGRTDVVDFLLRHGVHVTAKLKPHGQTGLHWAAYGGHADTVRLLLRYHAPVNVRDESFERTPIVWALFAWSDRREHKAIHGYYEIVEQLLGAGATIDREWLEQNGPSSRLMKRIEKDTRMRAILAQNSYVTDRTTHAETE